MGEGSEKWQKSVTYYLNDPLALCTLWNSTQLKNVTNDKRPSLPFEQMYDLPWYKLFNSQQMDILDN